MHRTGYVCVCAAGALALALAAPADAGQSQQNSPPSRNQQAQQTAPVPIADLYMAPASYFGRTITLHGKVDDVYSQHVLTIEQDRLFSNGQQVIVIIPQPDAIALDDTIVNVRGIVRPFTASAVAREYDLRGLPNDLLARWEAQPVIVADSVKTARGAELVRHNGTLPLSAAEHVENRPTSASPSSADRSHDASPTPQHDTGSGRPAASSVQAATGTSGSEGGGTIVDVKDVTGANDRQDLVGRDVRIMSARVQSLAGDRAFWIGPDQNHRVFVAVDATSVDSAIGTDRGLHAGDLVAITGTLKQAPKSGGDVKMTDWGHIDDADANALASRQVYIWAKSLQWLSHPGQ
jgi:hypothetical protein